jgi:non-specific serine/threonine protein kinase
VAGLPGAGVDQKHELGNLVDASLLDIRRTAMGETRFSLLDTLREFAWAQLDVSGERERVQRQHAQYYLDLAAQAASALDGPEQPLWLRRLEREHANLRAALEWLAAYGDAEDELLLAASLGYFWWTGGYLREGRKWLEHALARSPHRRDTLGLTALEAVGWLAAYMGDGDAGDARLEEALALARKLEDRAGVLRVLGKLIIAAYWNGRPERLPSLAADLDAETGGCYPDDLHWTRDALGGFALEAGDFAAANRLFNNELNVRRRLGDDAHVASAIASLCLAAHAQGDNECASRLASEALRARKRLRFSRGHHLVRPCRGPRGRRTGSPGPKRAVSGRTRCARGKRKPADQSDAAARI